MNKQDQFIFISIFEYWINDETIDVESIALECQDLFNWSYMYAYEIVDDYLRIVNNEHKLYKRKT